MRNVREYFKELKQSIIEEVNTSATGIVERVNEDTVNVKVDNLPLLINVPILSVKLGENVLRPDITEGDMVTVVFNDNDLSSSMVTGVVADSNSKEWDEVLSDSITEDILEDALGYIPASQDDLDEVEEQLQQYPKPFGDMEAGIFYNGGSPARRGYAGIIDGGGVSERF